MKRLVFSVLMLGLVTVGLYAAPTYTGAEGYITLPRVDVEDAGRFGLSLKYTHSGMFTPAINIVPVTFGNGGLELGWGWDLAGTTLNPMMVSLKFQFVKQASFGGYIEIPMSGADIVHGTIYLAWEETFQASKVKDSFATFLIGYTFDQGGNINFGIGFQRMIFIPQLYVVADFSNFPYRYGGIGRSHLNTDRGILNIGLRLVLTDFLSFDFAGTDLMDAGRGFMIGGNLYLSLWRGRTR